MTPGLTGLPIRSSPTRRSIIRTTSQLAHAHYYPALLQSATATKPPADTMLAKASKVYEANQPPKPRNALAKELFPSSSPSSNSDIRDQFKKPSSFNHGIASARIGSHEKQTHGGTRPQPHTGPPSQRALSSLYVNSASHFDNSFQNNTIDLTGPEVTGSSKNGVFFTEDDFSDEDNLDLDFQAPSALPPMPKSIEPATKENMPPPPTPTQKTDWSSSPPSHWHPPKPDRSFSAASDATETSLKRQSPGENDSFDAPLPKKRVLPWKRDGADTEGPATAQTPARSSRKDFWDPTASAVKEQKRQLKNQRQPQKQDNPDQDLKDDIKRNVEAAPQKVVPFSLSNEQRRVLELVVEKGQSVFFTGAAGTGKSVLMRAIIADLKKKFARDPERVAVTASTGLAACNIGGITLHSFSGIGLGKEDAAALVKKVRRNPKAKNRWLKVKCLIIDEVSMVDGELFDKLSQIGRLIRNNGRPWGGIQLIITGDFFQLPPVPEGGQRDVKFAFDASTWSTSIDHTIGLTEVFRQKDPEFARMLNEMRIGEISAATEKSFKSLSRPLKFDDGLDMSQLYPTRAQVESSNASRLRALPGELRRFEAMDSGDPQNRDRLLANMMAPKALDLKIGAQVMLIKNWDESLVNGSLGKVIAFSDLKAFEMKDAGEYDADMDDAMAKARQKLKMFSKSDGESESDGQVFPVVQFIGTDGMARVVLVQPEDWKVELPNGEVQATRSQLPLILAWALSIHKAQGQTLERVTVDLGKVFEKGQAYVALSRATSQHGLQVLNFNKHKVMAHPKVCNFYKQLYSVEEAQKVRPSSVSDFVSNRKGGASAPQKKPSKVIDLDDDEEAMAAAWGQ